MAGGPQLLGGPATSVPHGGSDHEGATFSGGSDLRMSLPIPDVAKLDRLNQASRLPARCSSVLACFASNQVLSLMRMHDAVGMEEAMRCVKTNWNH